MEETKTLNDRAKEAVVKCMEANQGMPEAVAELGKAYAAIAMSEMPGAMMANLKDAIAEIENL